MTALLSRPLRGHLILTHLAPSSHDCNQRASQPPNEIQCGTAQTLTVSNHSTLLFLVQQVNILTIYCCERIQTKLVVKLFVFTRILEFFLSTKREIIPWSPALVFDEALIILLLLTSFKKNLKKERQARLDQGFKNFIEPRLIFFIGNFLQETTK